jgi:hypothetical protein
MDTTPENQQDPPLDIRTQLRIVSVELNEATADLTKARHDVLYRRLRTFPARHEAPAWAAALIVGGIGAVIGAIPAMLVRGDNVLFVFIAVCAAYTILSPATLLLLTDREGEDDLNRREVRERALILAIAHRNALRERVSALHEQHRRVRDALRAPKSENEADQATGRSDEGAGD